MTQEADPYFPYEMRADLAALGFVYSLVPTSLGRLRMARPVASGPIDTLFLHGAGLDSSAWSPLVEAALVEGALGERRASGWAFLDLPGYGGSDPLTHDISLARAADAVVDVLQATGTPAVDLVGHSMGGFLALHLAAAHPDRFRSLTTVCGAYATIVEAVNAPLRTLVRAPAPSLIYLGLNTVAWFPRLGRLVLGVAARTGALRLSLAGLAAHPWQVPRSMLAALARGSRPRSFRYAQATGKGYHCQAVWSAISIPVVGVFGAADRMVGGRDADRLTAALPTARIVVLPEAGHLLPMEQPHALLRVILGEKGPPPGL